MTNTWKKAASLKELQAKGTMLVRSAGKQIALFHAGDGVLACNNRCPHEGFPLCEGDLDASGVLTCNWHNWKFDLRSGENIYGGDRLRVYPVELRGDEVWIDLADPPLGERIEQVMRQLRDAFDDNDYQRMARELARLQVMEADPLDALVEAIHWGHDRMEFGWTHAFAAAADWLELYHECGDDAERRLICVLESVAHIADDVLRERSYPFAGRVAPYDEDRFVDAIENEDEPAAVACMRGALSDGFRFETVERGLSRAALLHYNDFGHSIIYVRKARRLVERLGQRVAEPLLLGLARSLVFTRREDRIPEFRRYASALGAWGAKTTDDSLHMNAFRKLGINKALDKTVSFSKGEPGELYAALLGANARNMLAYDLEQQERIAIPISDNVGWLDFTHGITFANAVREECTRFPELWPAGLLQMACFSGRNASFTHAEADLDGWRVNDWEAFFARAVEKLYDHGCEEFIVSAHLLKTLLAARAEVRAGLPKEVSAHVVAAMNRFLNSPLKRKHARRTAHQALKFVALDA